MNLHNFINSQGLLLFYMNTHTHKHTYMHTYTHTQRCTYTHPQYTCAHTCTCTHTHRCTCTRAHIHTKEHLGVCISHKTTREPSAESWEVAAPVLEGRDWLKPLNKPCCPHSGICSIHYKFQTGSTEKEAFFVFLFLNKWTKSPGRRLHYYLLETRSMKLKPSIF